MDVFSCMYISGVPGTGKTMTVCKVMNDMSEQKEDYGEFVFLKLNALALTEPRQIYVQVICFYIFFGSLYPCINN